MLKNIPKGLLVICFAELWERFIFYGTLTFLLLYLTEQLHFTEKNAYSFWGLFIALAYLAPFLGGYYADKFLGFVKGTLIGGYTLVFACCILAFTKGQTMFFIGISVLLVGFGFYKSNLINLLGTLFEGESIEKDKAYTFLFMWMACGAIAGPAIFGLLINYVGWHAGFLVSLIGLFSSTLSLQLRKRVMIFKSLPQVAKNSRKVEVTLYFSMLLFAVFFYWLITYSSITNALLGFFSLFLFLFLVLRALHYNKSDRKKISALIFLIATTIVYYSAGLQIDGSLLLLIKNHINHSVLGWNIPVTFFSSLEGIFVLIFSPLVIMLIERFSKRGQEMSTYTKVSLGLFFAAISFALYGLAASFAAVWLVPLILIVIGTLFLAIADICEMPIVMATVSRYAPQGLKGMMMSLVLMCNAVAGYLGSKMGSLTSGAHRLGHVQAKEYVMVFVVTAAICVLFALLLLALKNISEKWLHNR